MELGLGFGFGFGLGLAVWARVVVRVSRMPPPVRSVTTCPVLGGTAVR